MAHSERDADHREYTTLEGTTESTTEKATTQALGTTTTEAPGKTGNASYSPKTGPDSPPPWGTAGPQGSGQTTTIASAIGNSATATTTDTTT